MSNYKRATRLLVEEQPDSATLERIEQLEYFDRDAPEEEQPQDFGGMSLPAYEEFLRALLPGHVHGYGVSYPADSPTDARPGSADKIAVMAQRARKGMCLFHPQDNRELPDVPPEEDDEDERQRQADLLAAREDSHRRRHAVPSLS